MTRKHDKGGGFLEPFLLVLTGRHVHHTLGEHGTARQAQADRNHDARDSVLRTQSPVQSVKRTNIITRSSENARAKERERNKHSRIHRGIATRYRYRRVPFHPSSGARTPFGFGKTTSVFARRVSAVRLSSVLERAVSSRKRSFSIVSASFPSRARRHRASRAR